MVENNLSKCPYGKEGVSISPSAHWICLDRYTKPMFIEFVLSASSILELVEHLDTIFSKT